MRLCAVPIKCKSCGAEQLITTTDQLLNLFLLGTTKSLLPQGQSFHCLKCGAQIDGTENNALIDTSRAVFDSEAEPEHDTEDGLLSILDIYSQGWEIKSRAFGCLLCSKNDGQEMARFEAVQRENSLYYVRRDDSVGTEQEIEIMNMWRPKDKSYEEDI